MAVDGQYICDELSLAQKIAWFQAAEILGISCRQMQRWTTSRRKRGKHRKRRPRRPLAGMMLHIDASQHRWFYDERWYDLLVIMDDATSEIYYAQLVEEESTRTTRSAMRVTTGSLNDETARHFSWLQSCMSRE